MRVENGQMSLAAYVRWTARVTQVAYKERYLPYGVGPTSVPETPVAAMPSNGSINNFRERDHGHHSGMPGADYFKMVRDAEYAWNHRMD